MWKLLRRSFWLALLGGGAYAAYSTWQRRQEPEPAAPPSWPPLEEQDGDVPAGDPLVAAFDNVTEHASEHESEQQSAADDDASPTEGRRWVEPIDGDCPPGYPIKGNDNSGIYHLPGGRFYDRTVPDRCYADEDDAQADGYRRAKA